MEQGKSISNNLGFGCVGLATYQSVNYAIKLLNQAFDKGINYFDTAPIYSKGYSEIILAKFLRHKREKVSVSSKFGLGNVDIPMLPATLAVYLNQKIKPKGIKTSDKAAPTTIAFRRIDRPDIEKSLTSSLKRLKTDYLDGFLLHEGLTDFLTDEALSYLHHIKTAGMVKKIGLATNYFNLKNDTQKQHWDILQYDDDPLSKEQQHFIELYPEHTHIYHSTLKIINKENSTETASKNMAGIILASEIVKNPNGRILFSTGNADHLKQNLLHTEKYLSTESAELRELLNHAFLRV